MVSALASQLTSGPLADLTAGTVDGNGFVTEVQSVVASYATSVDSALLPEFPNVDTLLQLEGQRIVADETSLNQQEAIGLLSSSDLTSQAGAAINALTAGPLFSLQTPLSGYAAATQAFESELNTLEQSLGSSSTTPVTPADASTTMLAETLAYQTDIHASAQVTHPNISNMVDQAVTNLENTASSISSMSSSDAQSAISSAITAFDTAIYDTTGIFGPQGAISESINSGRGFAPQTVDNRDAFSLTAVSGSASSGTATLTATLTTSSGTGISGAAVYFTLDGAFAGIAATDSDGVATLSGVPTSDTVGTDTGGVVAYYAGSIQEKSSIASGDLTVSALATSVASVSGTANFGGSATLVATLTSTSTGQGISGETVSFTLDNTSVGTATTDSSGVATLSGVTTTDAAGTYTDNVVASFAGDSTYAASSGTGDLTVAQAGTTLASVSGTASFGGDATLVATLTSNVTSQPISGETVDFTISGTSVGSGTTNSSGVATFTTTSATSLPVGANPGAVGATFAGDTNYTAAPAATGGLTVSTAATTLGSVSGTASFGGDATLVATLTSNVTSQPISGETVDFTISGTSVGSATTNSSGVATFTTTSPISLPVGDNSGVVGATFAGDTNYAAAPAATGDLTVSTAATTLASVSGTASFGGDATLVATLTSNVTSQPISGETVDFTISGVSVGSGTTNSSGVATFTTTSPISLPVGDNSGVVGASFAGDTNYAAAPNATGDLTVSQAATTLASVSGTASFGGDATLVATLTSNVTSQPISGETVDFTISGTSLGSGTTNSSGVATFTTTSPVSLPVGDNAGVVGASFAGDSNYAAAPNATGDLTVSPAATGFSNVVGILSSGSADLSATLTSSVSGQPISGVSVEFFIGTTDVGPATTDSNGIATLPDISTSEPSGTAISVTFAGNPDFNTSTGNGTLT